MSEDAAKYEKMPDKLEDLPDVLFIQVVVCPSCAKETAVNIPAKPPKGKPAAVTDTPCVHCKQKARASRDADGYYAISAAPCCYVVTATYGEDSRELRRVRAACRNVFQSRGLLGRGWEIYQSVGPHLARWCETHAAVALIVKPLLATPIVGAVSKNRLWATLCRTYLAGLSIVGILLSPLLVRPAAPAIAAAASTSLSARGAAEGP